jgi:hypothetical protein
MNGHFLADEVITNRDFGRCLEASYTKSQSKGQSTAEHKLVDRKKQEPLEAVVFISTEGKSSSLHTLQARYLCLEIETFDEASCNPRYRDCISQLQKRAYWNDDRDMSGQDQEELRIRSENRKLKIEVRGLAAENRLLKERLGRLVEFESLFPRCYFGLPATVVPVGYNQPPVAAAGSTATTSNKHGVIPDGYNQKNNENRKLNVETEKNDNSIDRKLNVETEKNDNSIAVVPAGYNPSSVDEVEVVEIADSSDDDAPEIVNGVDRKRSSTKKRKR